MAKKATLQGRKRINELAGETIMDTKVDQIKALGEETRSKTPPASLPKETKIKPLHHARNQPLVISPLDESAVCDYLAQVYSEWKDSGTVTHRQYTPRQVTEKLLDVLRGFLNERVAHERSLNKTPIQAKESCQKWLDHICSNLKSRGMDVGHLMITRSTK